VTRPIRERAPGIADDPTVRAIRIQHGGAVVRETHDPREGDGHAIVRVSAALLTRGDLPCDRDPSLIPGRRFVGIVQHAADPALAGARVVGDPDVLDPSSDLARRGLAALDPGRAVLGIRGADGCLAERIAIPERNLCVVPEGIDDEHALLAGVLGAAAHIARIEPVENKTFVSVIGSGLDALLAAQVMSRANASVRLLTTNAHRLELCTRWGIRHRHLDHAGRRADQDIVIHTADEPGSLPVAVAMARPRGCVILHGPPDHEGALDHHALAMIRERELRVLGSCSGSVRDGISALRAGTLDPTGLVTARTRLEELPGAISQLEDPAQIALMVRIA